MKNILQTFALVLMLSPAIMASWIPYYRMDSFAFLSDAVVLCEEKKIDFVETVYPGGVKDTHCVTQCRIIESFKGDIKVGADVKIIYGEIFRRYRSDQYGYMDGSTNPPTLITPRYVPTGKAVMFLKKLSNGDYGVVTAKLIQEPEILEFRQESVPGSLVLNLMIPERPESAKAENYGLNDFLKDVRLSVEASYALKSPVRCNWWTGVPQVLKSKRGLQDVDGQPPLAPVSE